MVPDTPDVEAALFSDNGVAAGLKPGKIVIDMSSISPIATKAFAKKINALGCDYLDAPVSGGEVGAKNASLSIMVGGPEACFEKIKPLFELMGRGFSVSAFASPVHPSCNAPCTSSAGVPIGATTTGPKTSAVRCPNTCAIFGAVKVITASARHAPAKVSS